MRTTTISATLLAAALVAGCGSSSSGGSGDENGGSISISGVNLNVTIGPEDSQNVRISGGYLEITIQPNSSIGQLLISADDSVVTIHDGTTIDKFIITGDRVTVFTNEVYAINSSGVDTVIAPIP